MAPLLHVSGHVADSGPGKWFNEGDPTGLYHLIVGEGQNTFVGNGSSSNFHPLVVSIETDANVGERPGGNQSFECQCLHAGGSANTRLQALAE